MKKNLLTLTVLVAVIAVISWSCSKVEQTQGVRQSINMGVAKIGTALFNISGTTGYQLLLLNDATAKSDFVLNDTITLSKIAGIYDFKPDTVARFNHFTLYRLFKKTGESENLIVNLPEILVKHPGHLHYLQMKDTIYPNNFTIKATDYHLYFNWWHNYEYKLAAGFTLNNEDAGSMNVSTAMKSEHSISNISTYKFSDGYTIATAWQNGDTARSSYSLTKNSDTLFLETGLYIRNEEESHKRERQYSLTIGDVVIQKSLGVDSIQVFVGGVLQKAAGHIIDIESDTLRSVFHHRDILLTFDDGTTSKVSTLIAPIREQLKTLKESLHSMYFSKRIVDYIAFILYFDEHEFHY